MHATGWTDLPGSYDTQQYKGTDAWPVDSCTDGGAALLCEIRNKLKGATSLCKIRNKFIGAASLCRIETNLQGTASLYEIRN